MTDTATTIRQLVADFADIPLKEATPETKFWDLNLDSLDMVEILMAVEIKFDIEIPDAEADQVETIQDAITLVEKYA